MQHEKKFNFVKGNSKLHKRCSIQYVAGTEGRLTSRESGRVYIYTAAQMADDPRAKSINKH